MAPKRKFAASTSFARLDAWARGAIWGMSLAGAPVEHICHSVTKTDGKAPSMRAVEAVIARKKADPEWRGRETHSGRPHVLTSAQQQEVVDLVFEERGKSKVTIAFCKQRLRFLRKVSRQTVERSLQAAGLCWLRRRTKTLVPAPAKRPRLEYAAAMLLRTPSVLRRFAYTDGTTFYLARSPADVLEKKRLALGKHVWRMASGKDGLWDENVGPSLYAKSQGLPVKIWGFLGHGTLKYFVLPKDGRRTTHMNGDRYHRLVSDRFAAWRAECVGDSGSVHLVQDHEKCLWQQRNLDALRKAGCLLETDYPRHSPDLNAIEGWWRVLRERLELTAPEDFEGREAFLLRLRRTVAWLNEHRSDEALALCRNQKERATGVLALGAAKTKW